jgi:hypothetical protein
VAKHWPAPTPSERRIVAKALPALTRPNDEGDRRSMAG